MGIIIAILIFGLIVTVHEFGHFICAKLSGIRVLEFSVGMGPKIIQKKKGETMYSLRMLPIGGFCAMEGEDATIEDEHGFRNAKLWKRMVVLFAGAFMNFVLGFLLLIGMVCMMDSVPTNKIRGFYGDKNGEEIVYTSQSYKTGLRHDDVICKIDGLRVYSTLDLNYFFATTTKDKHQVVVKRDGKKMTIDDVVFHDDKSGNQVDFGLIYKNKNPLTVIKGSGDMFMSMSHIVGLSLKQLVSGKVEKDEVSGPVGVVSTISEAAEESESKTDALFQLLYMTAMITINIGIFNLLPIPGLDGGRLLFCFIELVRRKPVKPEHEGYVHLIGMLLLFGLMIFATYNDILRLIKG